MTGYDEIREMDDYQLTEYFKKFAEHFFEKGRQIESSGTCRTYRRLCITEKIYLNNIGRHSNEI